FIMRGHDLRDRPAYFFTFEPATAIDMETGLGAVSNRTRRRMSDSELRSVGPADIEREEALAGALLTLNNAHAQELSWLEAERLQYLVRVGFPARPSGHPAALPLSPGYAARR